MQCFSSEHWVYVFCSIAGIAIYYPIATFIFPLLQFQDYGLDFKMNQTFLVLLSQCKLLIAAAATFFPYTIYLNFQLYVSLGLVIIVATISLVLNPCIIKKFNM